MHLNKKAAIRRGFFYCGRAISGAPPAMAAAHARNAAGAVAATHQALTRAHRRLGALLLLDLVVRRLRIFRAVAARVKIHLGVGSAHCAKDQRDGYE